MLIRLLAAIVSLSLCLTLAGHAFASKGGLAVGPLLTHGAASAQMSVPPAKAPIALAAGALCCGASDRWHGGESKPVQIGHPCTPDLAYFATQAASALFLAVAGRAPDRADSREGLPSATPLKPPRLLS